MCIYIYTDAYSTVHKYVHTYTHILLFRNFIISLSSLITKFFNQIIKSEINLSWSLLFKTLIKKESNYVIKGTHTLPV